MRLLQKETIEKIYNRKMLFCLVLILLILLYLPILQLFSIGTDNGSIPASLCYVFSVLFLPYLLLNIKELIFPPWYITFLWLYVVAFAGVRLKQYGISKSILHWLFGFYLLVIVLNVNKKLKKEDWLHILEIGACVFAVIHFLYMLWNHDIVWALICGNFRGNPNGVYAFQLPSLTRGGRNLDCTWLGLGAFFLKGKKKAFYITYAILYAFFGASRVGVISICLAIVWSLIYDPLYKMTKTNCKWYCLYASVLLIVLFGSGTAQTFLARMSISVPAPAQCIEGFEESTGGQNDLPVSVQEFTEQMLSGRAAMWKRVPQMFADNPMGYGVGNALRVMRLEYGFQGKEDVIHNVFLQWTLDEGVIGGVWYLGLLFAFLYNQWKKRPKFFTSPYEGYFFTYFVLSLVQFHGGEALMIFVLGCYLIDSNVKCMTLKSKFVSD